MGYFRNFCSKRGISAEMGVFFGFLPQKGAFLLKMGYFRNFRQKRGIFAQIVVLLGFSPKIGYFRYYRPKMGHFRHFHPKWGIFEIFSKKGAFSSKIGYFRGFAQKGAFYPNGGIFEIFSQNRVSSGILPKKEHFGQNGVFSIFWLQVTFRKFRKKLKNFNVRKKIYLATFLKIVFLKMKSSKIDLWKVGYGYCLAYFKGLMLGCA